MKNLFIITFFATLTITVSAQETLKVMQYNLVYYGQTTSFCTTSNNNVSLKDGYLNTIIDSVQPDVFCVNELGITYSGGDNIIADRLLNNVMNDNGANYGRATHTGTSNICNMIYFNKDKLGFHKQSFINKDLNNSDIIREIDFYTLYYKDANLATHQDTVYMTFIVAHLKAGSYDDNKLERAKATAAVINHVENSDLGPNLFFMGDLNQYSNLSTAYQNLTNYSNSTINFYDPINQEGEWHNGNSLYRSIHTQATRTVDNGCYAIGGMDDRFDFVLINKSVRDNLNGVQYKSGSYKAFGNDGSQTNNGSPLEIANNTVVSPTLAQALFDMSDHVPVVLELDVRQGAVGINDASIVSSVELNNPFTNELKVRISAKEQLRSVNLMVYDITGKQMVRKNISVNSNRFYQSINTSNLAQGLYILKITDINSGSVLVNEKLVKQ